jgi:glycerol transport system ATP-binding protein
VLFDEPLTVIDPHLKWQLRRKLKQIHHELKLTLIYVTHDQVEALTFADQVVVMSRGKAVQVGSADALFERPAHTFVGHFIGSPGMNFLPGQWRDGGIEMAGRRYAPDLRQMWQRGCRLPAASRSACARSTCAGSRQRSAGAARARGARAGHRHLLAGVLTVDHGEAATLRARLGTEAAHLRAGDTAWLSVFNRHTCFYVNEELVQ